jgi:hypothetical protein
MLSIEQFKKSLGPLSNSLSEAEIEHMRDVQDKFADILFDIWLKKRNPKGQFPIDGNGGKI